MLTIHKAITTVMGLGFAPFAPGTFGAGGAVLFYWLLATYAPSSISLWPLLGYILFFSVIGIYSTNKVISLWGDDPSKVVMDEFVGFLITMLFVNPSFKTILLGFVLFRFFDILKPLGIRTIDKKVKGGLGVMLDDVLAGIYACLSLHFILWLEQIVLN